MGKGRIPREALAKKPYLLTPGVTAALDAQDSKADGAQADIDLQKRLAALPMGVLHQPAGFPQTKALEENCRRRRK